MDIKLNLGKFKSAIITTPKGNRCIVIPIIENNLVEGKEGGVYSEFTAWEIKDKKTNEHGFQDTHIVKQKFSKEVYEAMSDDQRKSTPIFGVGVLDI
jgi:hypothetical protein